MSATSKFSGGTILQYGGISAPTSTSAYADIGLLHSDYKFGKSATVHELGTHNDAVVDKTKRKGGGLIDEGKVSLTVLGDMTDTNGHKALYDNVGKMGYFRLKKADSYSPVQYATFTAVIESVSITYPLDGYEAWDLSLAISAPVTHA